MFKLHLVALIMLSMCFLTKAAPYQELEPRKGHVPVYIRHGNEALTQIHPGLAEAFNELEQHSLQAENLIKEVPATTEQPAEAEAEAAPAAEAATTVKSSTESDIASFDAIKAMDA